jgi:hypothetical protein
MVAVAGWIVLAGAIALDRPALHDRVAGQWLPVLLATAYTALILLFFWDAPGGFGSLADVQLLFTSPWVALAGWLHYLAFDLWMGARIARESAALKLPRWPLIILLPLTFLFGPAGYLAFETIKAARQGDAS